MSLPRVGINKYSNHHYKLDHLLELNLGNASLIKIVRARNHTVLKGKLKSMDALDPEEIKRIESDFSFNYSQTTFDDREENNPDSFKQVI